MKAILTLTALLTASPALASDELIQSYKAIAVMQLQEEFCGYKATPEKINYLANNSYRAGGKAEEMLPFVAGMVYAYRGVFLTTGAYREFCKAAYMER